MQQGPLRRRDGADALLGHHEYDVESDVERHPDPSQDEPEDGPDRCIEDDREVEEQRHAHQHELVVPCDGLRFRVERVRDAVERLRDLAAVVLAVVVEEVEPEEDDSGDGPDHVQSSHRAQPEVAEGAPRIAWQVPVPAPDADEDDYEVLEEHPQDELLLVGRARPDLGGLDQNRLQLNRDVEDQEIKQRQVVPAQTDLEGRARTDVVHVVLLVIVPPHSQLRGSLFAVELDALVLGNIVDHVADADYPQNGQADHWVQQLFL